MNAVREPREPSLAGSRSGAADAAKAGTADGEGLSGGSAGSGTPRLALPGNLPRSLRYLDDGQLDELLRAAAAEARRRGWKVQAEPHPGRPTRDVSESAPAPRPGRALNRFLPAWNESFARRWRPG